MRLRRGTGSLYRKAKSIELLLTRDRYAVARFISARYPIAFPLRARLDLVRRFVATTNAVRAYHTQSEILAVVDRVLRLAGRRDLTVVECGTGKGASTSKLSLAAKLAGGRLVAFDSFRGIPANDEVHQNLDGRRVVFRAGAFAATIGSVRRTVERFGAIDVCELRKGLFEETLARFDGPVDVALLDVDLASSTRACVARLFPKLREGGALFSQDGHLRATVELFANERFWRDEVGVAPPNIAGLGRAKLLEIRPRV